MLKMALPIIFADTSWMENCNCECTLSESPDYRVPGESASNLQCVNNTLSDGVLGINSRSHFWTIELVGIALYFPLLVIALHNLVMYVILQERYKQKSILIFYILTITSITLRICEFGMLTVFFYCYIKVINVAQAATISKLGLGICHTQILTQVIFEL